MTPLPKKKHTKARSGARKFSQRLKLSTLVICASCKKLKYPHRACPHCGNYK